MTMPPDEPLSLPNEPPPSSAIVPLSASTMAVPGTSPFSANYHAWGVMDNLFPLSEMILFRALHGNEMRYFVTTKRLVNQDGTYERGVNYADRVIALLKSAGAFSYSENYKVLLHRGTDDDGEKYFVAAIRAGAVCVPIPNLFEGTIVKSNDGKFSIPYSEENRDKLKCMGVREINIQNDDILLASQRDAAALLYAGAKMGNFIDNIRLIRKYGGYKEKLSVNL